MPVPPADLDRIRRFCAEQVPSELRDHVRIEHRLRGNTVTIVELQPVWADEPKSDWMEIPQARMKYDGESRGWTLYWFDRNSRAHRYELLAPHQPIRRLLTEYDRDPTNIFKG